MRFSASRTRLLALCGYGFRPDVEDRPWPDTPESAYGRALHRCSDLLVKCQDFTVAQVAADFGVTGADAVRMGLTFAHMRRWLQAAQPEGSELKLALDLGARTARILTEPGERDYSGAEPWEIPMTLDLVKLGGLAPEVLDWKTGYSADGYWPQIATNALALAWLTGATTVKGGILHATEQGVNDSRVRTFNASELDTIADDLAFDVASVRRAKPNPGSHCTELHCGAFGVCPATLEAVEGVAALVPPERLTRAGHELSLTITSADHAAWALHRLKAYDAYAKQVKDAIKAFVGDKEHPLSEGGYLRESLRVVERLSTPDLIALARSKGANDAEIRACFHDSIESGGIRVSKSSKQSAA